MRGKKEMVLEDEFQGVLKLELAMLFALPVHDLNNDQGTPRVFSELIAAETTI